MQTLNDDNRLFVKSELVANPFAAALLKAECGKLNLLTVQQGSQVLTEQLGIDSVDMLKVNLAVRTGSDLVAVDVVIVKAHKYRLLAVDTKLSVKSVCRCGFTRRAGACKHNRLCSSLTDLVCNGRESLLVQSLVDTDKLSDLAVVYKSVQVGYGFALHKLAPLLALVTYCKQVRLLLVL